MRKKINKPFQASFPELCDSAEEIVRSVKKAIRLHRVNRKGIAMLSNQVSYLLNLLIVHLWGSDIVAGYSEFALNFAYFQPGKTSVWDDVREFFLHLIWTISLFFFIYYILILNLFKDCFCSFTFTNREMVCRCSLRMTLIQAYVATQSNMNGTQQD